MMGSNPSAPVWERGRVVEDAGLENQRAERLRGFESYRSRYGKVLERFKRSPC